MLDPIITFLKRVMVANIIPQNMIINLSNASDDNHIPQDKFSTITSQEI